MIDEECYKTQVHFVAPCLCCWTTCS